MVQENFAILNTKFAEQQGALGAGLPLMGLFYLSTRVISGSLLTERSPQVCHCPKGGLFYHP
jgi:hypothetical protein